MKKKVTFEFSISDGEDLEELRHFNKVKEYYSILKEIHAYLDSQGEYATLDELKQMFYKRVKTYGIELD